MPGPLNYPSYHNYIKPIDYVRVLTTKRTNLIFDSDTIAGAVRIYLGYQYGPFLENWQRPDSAVTAILNTSFLDVSPHTYAPERGTWGGHQSWGITANQAYIAQPSSTWGGWQSQFLLVWTDLSDIDISTNVSTTAGGNAGLIVRSDRNGIGLAYFLNTSIGKVQFSQLFNYTSNGANVLFTGTTSISAGVTYTLRVVAVGDNFSLYLNGNLEGTFNTSYSNTRISHGLWATTTGARFPAPFRIIRSALPIATTYTVRNYDGDIVATGPITDDHIDLPDSVLRWRGNGPYGWYRVYLTGPDHNDFQWQTAYGDCSFYRVRSESNVAANPPGWAYPSASTADDDEIARAVMVPTVLRISVSSSTSGTPAANNVVAAAEAAYLKTNWVDLAYPTRPRTIIGAFGNGTQGIGASVITPTVNLLKNVIKTWEPRNEPTYEPRPPRNSGEDYISLEFDEFRNAVKAADPTGRVIGPGVVEWANISQAGGQGFVPVGDPWSHLWFIQSFLQAAMARGGTAYLDGLSVHAYNEFNGDLSFGRKNLSDLKGVIAGTGYPGPIYQTEQGYEWLSHGWERPRHAARWTSLQWTLCELYGIPLENDFYWYDHSHGFDNVPFWWIDTQGPGPQALPLRVMGAELADRTFVSQFDFGHYGNQLYAGGTFSRADGSKLACLIAASYGATNLTLSVTGATSLTCVDPWGNTFTLPAPGGLASFPIAELAQWIRLPNGVTVTPLLPSFGTNFALAATPSATGDQTNLASLNSGEIENHYYGDPPAWTEYQDRSNVLPQTITLDLNGTVTANRVIVYAFPPWQVNGTLLDFDIDTFDGATWTTRLHRTPLPLKTFMFTSIGRCIYESFWDEQSIWDVTFPNASITKVRLVIRGVSYGDTEHPTLLHDIYNDNYAFQEVRIQDIQVFGTGSVVIPPPPATIRNPAMGGVVR